MSTAKITCFIKLYKQHKTPWNGRNKKIGKILNKINAYPLTRAE